MSIVNKIRDSISRRAQSGLGIDDVRHKLEVTISHLGRLENHLGRLESGLGRTEQTGIRTKDQIRRLSEHVNRLKSVMAWSAGRAEPWLWTDMFSQSEPESDLAGFLYNFLPNRVLFDVGANSGDFAEAVLDIGYEVFCFEAVPETFERLNARMAGRPRVRIFNLALGSPESNSSTATTLAALAASGTVPGSIDFLKIDAKGLELEVVRGLGSVRPAVVQAEFQGEDRNSKIQRPFNSSDVIGEMRDREYYWHIIIFRVEGEEFVRMATNLTSASKVGWGKILFFHDYQLFLKAFHWCQGELPRFRAASLSR